MSLVETDIRKIVARLLRDGWVRVGGARHGKFGHPQKPGAILVVPRHREQSPGAARSIAPLAGLI